MSTIDSRYIVFIYVTVVHSTTNEMIKRRSDLLVRMSSHTSPLLGSYGVFSPSYTKKDDRDISKAHCILFEYT